MVFVLLYIRITIIPPHFHAEYNGQKALVDIIMPYRQLIKYIRGVFMQIIFTLDAKNYTDDMPVTERFGVRAIIKKDGLYAMQKSRFGEYKLPGGGVEGNETYEEALIREVCEETGLFVEPESIREIGEVLDIHEDIFEKGHKYVAHSLFYFCEVKSETTEPALTESELARGFELEWADIDHIIQCNEQFPDINWLVRDTKFLKWLKENEGVISK